MNDPQALIEQQANELQEFFVNMFQLVGHEKEEAQQLAGQFFMQIVIQAISNLIAEKNNYRHLTEEFKTLTTLDEIGNFLAKHFTLSQFEKSMGNTGKELLQDYLKTIEPDLSDEQKILIKAIAMAYEERGRDETRSK